MAHGFWSGKNVLLTGAGGFLGSWVAQALVAAGANVTVILRDQPGISNFRLLGLASRVNIASGTIVDHALVERAFNEYEIDTCFHLAAQAIVGAANRSPLSTFESNIRGTWTVLEACRTSKLVERVIVASSDKAYGTQPVLPYTEDMPLLGINPYDASKTCTDILARSYHHAYGLPVAVTRCANIYGGGDLNLSRLIPGTILAALRGEEPIIRSDGTPVREYLYIQDAVAAYLLLGERLHEPGVAGEAFNFGTDDPITVLDLVALIQRTCDRTDLRPRILSEGKLAGEIDQQYLSNEKTRRVLGWQARYSLAQGLDETVAWYRRFADQVQRATEAAAPAARPLADQVAR